jgi:hypothetical protein
LKFLSFSVRVAVKQEGKECPVTSQAGTQERQKYGYTNNQHRY